ncbi:MAG: ribokinase [Synergistaceae bacterium]|nr:ribokinase [Synergistaceae bacterium]
MKKILNIGSINIDYVYDVKDFVKPGETIPSLALNRFPGGKGLNQSIALAKAGGRVSHAGKTGADGRGMIDIMRDAGVDVSFVDSSGSTTGHAIIQVNSAGENCIILHAGANSELDEALIDRALGGFGEGDFLVLQNEVNGIPCMMKRAREKKLRIAFNLAPFGPEIKGYPLDLVDYFLVNEVEGRGLSGKDAPEDIVNEILRMFPSSSVVLTIGREGVVYRDAKATLIHGIYDVPVVDTTAAGDTFTGYFLSSLVDGQPVEEALRRASVASSLAVSRKGASSSVPTLDETLSANLKYLGQEQIKI